MLIYHITGLSAFLVFFFWHWCPRNILKPCMDTFFAVFISILCISGQGLYISILGRQSHPKKGCFNSLKIYITPCLSFSYTDTKGEFVEKDEKGQPRERGQP